MGGSFRRFIRWVEDIENTPLVIGFAATVPGLFGSAAVSLASPALLARALGGVTGSFMLGWGLGYMARREDRNHRKRDGVGKG